MNYVGIDIGSTASKLVAKREGEEEIYFVVPTGWSGKEVAIAMKSSLKEKGIDVESEDTVTVATGYGRVSVDFANHMITEITCHGRGAREWLPEDGSVIDVGGQDTKVIVIEERVVKDFLMNDKCSAGTGKFLEVMANRLGITLEELFLLGEKGKAAPISSLCTVFAESEVISYIGEGRKREDIAAGIIDSVAEKVSQLASRKELGERVVLTGGLSESEYFAQVLSEKLGRKVHTSFRGRFAGAKGAMLLAMEKGKAKRR